MSQSFELWKTVPSRSYQTRILQGNHASFVTGFSRGICDTEGMERKDTHVKRKIETKSQKKEPPYLTQIRDIATDVGVDDLSTRHDWYAHGRRDDEKQ